MKILQLTFLLGCALTVAAMPDHRQNFAIGQSRSTTEAPKSVQEQNKKIVMDFYQQLFVDKNVDSIDKFIDGGNKLIQHNPLLADGRADFKSTARRWFRLPWKSEIQRVVAEGDLVFLHVKVTSKYLKDLYGGAAVSMVDMYRLDKGKIVEHWDVVQSVPENSVNNHPMF